MTKLTGFNPDYSPAHTFLPLFQIKSIDASHHVHFSSSQLDLILHLHWPSLNATNQTILHTWYI